jgi:hypothetical protein
MTTILNTLAHTVFQIPRTRIGRFAPMVLAVLSVVMIMNATPGDFVDTRVYDFTGKTSPIAVLNKYVRVRGVLAYDQAIESSTQLGTGTLRLSGGRYIPMQIDGAQDPLFVLEKDLPPASEGGMVELVGLIVTKQSFPVYYMKVETPPNLPLKNNIALAGLAVAAALGLWVLLGVLMRMVHFAPGVLGVHEQRGIGLYWFGGLGSANANATVREAAVRAVEARHELRFESADGEGWSVHVRRIQVATPVNVATSFGPLPALRLRFVDERGQTRSGTLVCGDAKERGHILSLLNSGRGNGIGVLNANV